MNLFVHLAMNAYENQVRSSGQTVSHKEMKEILAASAAAEVDNIFESNGIDFLDREKAKRAAVKEAYHLAEENYGEGGTFDP